MTKAQEVRGRRLEKRSKGITVEAEKIFDWILYLMDRDTKRNYCGPLEIVMYENSARIQKVDSDDDVCLSLIDAMLHYNEYELFEELSKVVNREDGFEGKLTPHAIHNGKNCIMFKVVIK